MGLFRYEAVDGNGKVLHGAMNAASEQQVAQALAQRGFTLRAILSGSPQRVQPKQPRQQAARPQATAGMAAVTISSGVPVSIKSLVPAARLAMFFRQLSTLVRSGVPLYQSLVDLAPVTRDRRLKAAIPRIQQSMQSGQSLSGALSDFPGLFPAHTIASIWSGELAGKLDVQLDEIATDFEQEASDTRYGRIGWGLTKLTVIGLILTFPLFNMKSLVAGQLGEIAGVENGGQLISYYMVEYRAALFSKCLPLAALVIASWIVWGYMKRVPTVKRLLDGILLRVPVWGKLHRYRSAARFLHVMEQLYAAGVNPKSAWSAASITPKNSEIAEKLRIVHAESSTSGVTDLAGASGVFEPEDVGLISTGEKTGQVPASLSKLAELYADKALAAKSVGKMYSVSIAVSVQIAVGGLIMIIMASSYFGSIFK